MAGFLLFIDFWQNDFSAFGGVTAAYMMVNMLWSRELSDVAMICYLNGIANYSKTIWIY